MNIVLDLDGVLITTPPWKKCEILEDGFPTFNNNAVGNLNFLLQQTHANIILSTSHRNKFTLTQWVIIFKSRGIMANIIGKTPECGNRKSEIITWSKSNIEKYIVLDDDKRLYELPDPIKERCIITSPLIGLSYGDTLLAIQKLKSPN